MSGSREGWIVFAGVCAVLAIATVLGMILRRRVSETGAAQAIENLNARIRAWWIMVAVVSGSLFAGPKAVIVLFAFISFAALREFITLTPTRAGDHDALFVSFFFVVPAQYMLVWIEWYGVFTIFIPVYVFLILPTLTVVSSDLRDFLARTADTQWGLMISTYCISHVPALLMLRIKGYDPALLVVYLIIVVQSSDVLQYVWGKLVGRRAIAPVVSPSKTVEGFLGGIATATALGACLWWITPFKAWQAAAMSLLITVMGFLGGLVMSAIKRDRGVKNWGNLIEGHGGMLDRIDSVCFAAPIFFHLTRYFFAEG